MEKTEGSKKTVIVIDEQGNIYESTYPKRARGLIKAGRARYVDENTICLACPPIENHLEDNKMNNNETSKNIDVAYIMDKIDAIMEMNAKALATDYSKVELRPGADHPVVAVCETNNKMIDFLNSAYLNLRSKNDPKDAVIEALTSALYDAIEKQNNDAIESISSKLQNLVK